MKGTTGILVLSLLASGASAAFGAPQDDPMVLQSEGFLQGHPDMLWRNRGAYEYQRRRYADAARFFGDAAFYGDKPSQAMLAMMLWNGEGVDADRAEAYAWIDLAAERGYTSFVATREKFWAGLSEDERRRALEVGKDLYAKYGDENAQDRLDFEMIRTRNRLTGSRLGRPGTVVVRLPGPDGRTLRNVDGSIFYSARYWNPGNYRSWQDEHWEAPAQGRVDVGPVQVLDDDAPAAPDQKR